MLLYTLFGLNWFLILLISHGFCSKSTANQNNMSEIIMNDIESAFKEVTNVTRQILRERIIPELYNFTSISDFLFKIPNKKNKMGYSMISLERAEMMKPIFPNISLNHFNFMNKNQQPVETLTNNKDFNENKAQTKVNLWSVFGLDGWSGEIAYATDILENKHKETTTFRETNTSDSKELPKSSDESINKSISLIKDSPAAKPRAITKINTKHKDISENIYISRANNPFGLSTKWTYRNETANLTQDDRSKRALVELYSMIKCATGCEPLTYQSYGCFCGFLGNGIPVDGIDTCCKQHDNCYEQSSCISYLQYFVPYIWKCYRGKPICALSHGEFGGPASCAALLCYCDLRLAICLRKFSCPQYKAICRSSLSRKIQNLFY